MQSDSLFIGVQSRFIIAEMGLYQPQSGQRPNGGSRKMVWAISRLDLHRLPSKNRQSPACSSFGKSGSVSIMVVISACLAQTACLHLGNAYLQAFTNLSLSLCSDQPPNFCRDDFGFFGSDVVRNSVNSAGSRASV